MPPGKRRIKKNDAAGCNIVSRPAASVQKIKIIDTVWVIVYPDKDGIVYDTIATNPRESWRKLAEGELMGTGVSNQMLHDRGFRARRVEVVLLIR
jgi:hypothetical protein